MSGGYNSRGRNEKGIREERGTSSCVNCIMKYIPDVEKGSFIFFLDVVEMEYIMRLYLGLDSMTVMSDEIPKVEVHYVLLYDLIKLHKIILIFLQRGTPL